MHIINIIYHIVFVNFRDAENYSELHFTMKIPMSVVMNKDSKVRRYKYHVESSATENNTLRSLEFVSGPDTSGEVLGRSLLLFKPEKSQLKGE